MFYVLHPSFRASYLEKTRIVCEFDMSPFCKIFAQVLRIDRPGDASRSKAQSSTDVLSGCCENPITQATASLKGICLKVYDVVTGEGIGEPLLQFVHLPPPRPQYPPTAPD